MILIETVLITAAVMALVTAPLWVMPYLDKACAWAAASGRRLLSLYAAVVFVCVYAILVMWPK